MVTNEDGIVEEKAWEQYAKRIGSVVLVDVESSWLSRDAGANILKRLQDSLLNHPTRTQVFEAEYFHRPLSSYNAPQRAAAKGGLSRRPGKRPWSRASPIRG